MDHAAIAERLKPPMRAALIKMSGISPAKQTLKAMQELGLICRNKKGTMILTPHGAVVLRLVLEAESRKSDARHQKITTLPEIHP